MLRCHPVFTSADEDTGKMDFEVGAEYDKQRPEAFPPARRARPRQRRRPPRLACPRRFLYSTSGAYLYDIDGNELRVATES